MCIRDRPYLKIVGVVSGSDLHHTGTKIHLDIPVGHNRDLFVYQGKDDIFADEMLIAGIVGMDCNRRISQHSLRTGSSQLDVYKRQLPGWASW